MKKEQTETKLKPALGLTRHLISGLLRLAASSLICARASAQSLFAIASKRTEEQPMNPLTQFKKISILPVIIALTLVVVGTAGSARAGMSDFDGDGHPDYVLYNPVTRQTAIWYLKNNVFLSGRYGPTIPAGWSVVDVADFNGDGHPDYVLENGSQTAIWYMNDNVLTRYAWGPTLPSGWFLGAVGDFNGDGKPDYLLYTTNVGSNFPTAIWYMNNNVHVASASGPTLPDGWFLTGVADFNGDGKADFLLWRGLFVVGDIFNNRTAIWYLNNNAVITGRYGPTIPLGWSVVGVADFDRDGQSDYVLENANTHQTAIWYLNNNVFTRGAYGPTLPPGWNLVAPFAGGTAPSDCAGCWDYP